MSYFLICFIVFSETPWILHAQLVTQSYVDMKFQWK